MGHGRHVDPFGGVSPRSVASLWKVPRSCILLRFISISLYSLLKHLPVRLYLFFNTFWQPQYGQSVAARMEDKKEIVMLLKHLLKATRAGADIRQMELGAGLIHSPF